MHDDDSFIARTPDGRRVRLRVKRDIDDQPVHRPGRSFLEVLKADAADAGDDDAGDRSDENTGLAGHPIVQLATLLVASGHKADIASALQYLLNTSHGAALLHRTSTLKAAKDDPPMDTSEHLDIIMKRFGPVEFAKHICKTGSAPCTEAEFVSSAAKHEHALHPELRPDAAYAKLHEREESVRRACVIAKAGESGAHPTADPASNANSAHGELMEKTAEYRAAHPELSVAQAFTKVFTDPANIELAKRERVESQPW